MQFFPVIKSEFPASLLQSSVSHDPSEIILICLFAVQETCIIIIFDYLTIIIIIIIIWYLYFI